MDSLVFVKGVIGVLVFLAAIGAFVIQMQMRKRIPPIIKASPKVLRQWHLWLGRTALGGFVLNSMICLLIGLYPAPRIDVRHLAHGILAAVGLALLLGKALATRRKVKWAMKRIVPIGIAVFALQAAVFLTATVFAVWARITGLV